MAITYTQTSNLAPCGAISACSTFAPASDADGMHATTGGTGSTTELSCGVASNSTELCFMAELDVQDTVDLSSGTVTMRINVTSAQNDLTWEHVYVCRVTSTCGSAETLGQVNNIGQSVSSGGVFSQSINISAASSHGTGDAIYIPCAFANSNTHAGRSINITPDQNVDTPFTAGSTGGPGGPKAKGSGQHYRRLRRQVMS